MTNNTAAAAAAYKRERSEAEEDGTALQDQTDDFAPADLYHAAQEIAAGIGSELTEMWETIGVSGIDPTAWERLDVARAASYLRHHSPAVFAELSRRYAWLSEYAEGAAHDPIGALADQF